jgi:hypothetical protein
MVTAGFPSITASELMEARAVGLSGDYVRAMKAAGIQGDLDDFVELRSVGVDPAFAARAKASGLRIRSADDLVELRTLGGAALPQPPARAHSPRSPANPVDPGDG